MLTSLRTFLVPARRRVGAKERRPWKPAVEACEARALLSVTYSHVHVPSLTDAVPPAITVGGDGNLWFAQRPHVPPYPLEIWGPYVIGKVTPSGEVTEFVLPHDSTYPESITTGPDGNVWFTEGNNYLGFIRIARITPAGVITAFPLPHGAYPYIGQLTSGPGGALWAVADNGIDRISTSGDVTNFPLFSTPSFDNIASITAGPDGNVWFAGYPWSGFAIARMTPSGVVTKFPGAVSPQDLIAGPDGNVWFLDSKSNTPTVAKISPAGVVTEYALPPNTTVSNLTADRVNNDIWFTAVTTGSNPSNPAISGFGRVTPAGDITIAPGFPQQDAVALASLAFGPGGFLWYAGGYEVGKAVFAPLTVSDVERFNLLGEKDTHIVLTFSQPLELASAQNLGNFSLLDIRKSRDGHFTATPVRLDSAAYNGTAVTLSVHGRLRPLGHYVLVVNGIPHAGLVDQDGEPLSGGGAGTRGQSFVTIVPKPTHPHSRPKTRA